MNKKFRKLILPVSLLVASQSYGLGLGSLQVNSALDEKLEGKIPFVLDGTEDIEKIQVSVASDSDYERVGLDKSYVPSNITVAVQEENGKKYIQITSKGPVSEPIVSLLLVVDWANGHLLREYTLLLDPPIYTTTTEQSYSEPVQTQTYQAPEKIENNDSEISQNNSNISFRQSNQVVVQSGDTLWKIAKNANTGSSSLQQTMVAIFNNNLSAFQNNNMNLLKKGATLIIPDSDQVAMVSNGQAEEEVKIAVQNWTRLQDANDDSDSSTISNVDYGIELVPPNDSDSTESNDTSGSNVARINTKAVADLTRAREELASYDLENSELASRVAELEQIVKDQELALSLKDTSLAQLQDQLTTQDQPVDSVNTEDESELIADDVWDESQDAEQIAGVDDLSELPDNQEDETLNDIDTEGGLDDVVDTSVDSGEQAQDDKGTIEVTEVDPVKDQQNTQAAATTQEKSLMDKVLDYKYEGLIGLGVLLLGFLGFTYFKRKGDDTSGSGEFLDSISNSKSESSEEDSSVELDLSSLDDEIDDELGDVEPEVDVMDDDRELSEDDFDLDIDDINLEELSEDSAEDELDETDQSDNDTNTEVDNTELSDTDFENISLNEEGEIEGLDEDLNDELDLDLDLELDDPEELEEPQQNIDSTEQKLEEDFDFDLDIGQDDQELDDVVDDSEELEEMVFDTGERSIISEESDSDESGENEELEFDLDEDMFATDDLELDFDEDDANSDKTELSIEALNVDELQELDEDLDLTLDIGDEVDNDKTEVNIESIDADELDDAEVDDSEEEIDIGLDFDDMVDDDAIDTKLDLAKAYFEMGDNAGASQMVTEILEEGNDEQKAKAEELKNELENS